MQSALAFFLFRISRRTHKRIGNQGKCGNTSAANRQKQFPIGEQFFQRPTPCISNLGNCERRIGSTIRLSTTSGETPFLPNDSYLTETRQAMRSQEAGGCTGLCNTPMPEMETSTESPGVIGPTPAGVPVAIRSPGRSVIMREIQRIK